MPERYMHVEAPPGRQLKQADVRYAAARARRAATIDNLDAGLSLTESWSKAGFSRSGYQKARQTHPDFAAQVDVLIHGKTSVREWDGTPAEFFALYFGHRMAWFQLLWLEAVASMPPGSILMALFPPEHGKTTMFEDFASMTLALNPEYRFAAATSSLSLARRIGGRIKHRMEPMGPSRAYVRAFGPFEPQFGTGSQQAQPWGADFWNVYKKRDSDERDYSFNSLGVGSEIIGSRLDHLHVDDPQSLKKLGKTKGRKTETISTEALAGWFVQDGISRTGTKGYNTIALTRVGLGDFGSWVMRQQEWIDAGLLKVIKFPAIVQNPNTGQFEPLWKEKYSMEEMEQLRIKSTDRIWNIQYMHNPEANQAEISRTFKTIARASVDTNLSFLDPPSEGRICYVTIDPALGSRNVTMGMEVTPNSQLRIRYISDMTRFSRNEDIIGEAGKAIAWMESKGAKVTDLVIESKNFQAGLARDSRLTELALRTGVSVREHLTGINKYDADIGVASMASSFIRHQIVIPWQDDSGRGGNTRFLAEELIRQLEAWEAGMRGTELIQDQVMALWFGWILWESRWRQPQQQSTEAELWQRTGLSYAPSLADALVVPSGWRP